MKRSLLLILLLLFPLIINAQRVRCSIIEKTEKVVKENPIVAENFNYINNHVRQILSLNKRQNTTNDILIIPVVVHILWNTQEENLSDDRVLTQIKVLNEDFRKLQSTNGYNDNPVGADTRIMFRLAAFDPDGNPTTGITRTYTDSTLFYDDPEIKFTNNGGHDAWNTKKYLNIWVCNVSGVLGYAYYPGVTSDIDGVVILNQTFGLGAPIVGYNLGRTSTHEIGHYLNLLHIWGDGGCEVDDEVSDTPNSDGPTSGCPFPIPINCGSEDMIQNYLDYSDDDCMNIFTVGQSNRMRAAISVWRSDLFNNQPFNTEDYFISVSDNSQNQQSLIFGYDPSATDSIDMGLGEVPLPADIENGFFDARFLLSSGKNSTPMDIRPITINNTQWDLTFKSANYPVTFSWDSLSFTKNEFVILNDKGNIFIDMNTQNSLQVADTSIKTISIIHRKDYTPVELINFTAKASYGSVNLEWQTATETNNRGFEIQRSFINKNVRSAWQPRRFINGMGTSIENHNYRFTDKISKINDSKIFYRIKQIDYDGSFTYSKEIELISAPAKFALSQNYPNPFNPSTKIRYSISSESNVNISIYNSLGEKVTSLVNRKLSSGNYEIQFSANSLPSGIYFYQLKYIPINSEQKFTITKKMMLLK